MVTDEQDYQAHFTDPDTLVNWDCVQQVVRASNSNANPPQPVCIHNMPSAAIQRNTGA